MTATMSDGQPFFNEKKAAAVQKHKMLHSYAAVFASKTGRSGGDVAIVDGNAGPGQYLDGSPGSPLLLSDVAEFVEDLAGRKTVLTFVEKDPKLADDLRGCLSARGMTNPPVVTGDLDDKIDLVLERSKGLPLLTFLDPFGGSIGFEAVTRHLMRGPSLPSEVLLHFSLISVRRKGTAAQNEVTSPKLGEQLDHFLGGAWWERIMADRDPQEDGSATRQAMAVSERYRRLVEKACNCRSIAVDVRAAPGQLPIYRMILFTRSEHGLWYFANAAGSGYLEWVTHCDLAAYRQQQIDNQATPRLFPDPEPDRSKIDLALAAETVPRIASNLRQMLSDGPVHLGRSTEEVYGSTIGRAREKHVRAAARELMASGDVDHHKLKEMATATLFPKR